VKNEEATPSVFLHHIIIREIERKAIFKYTADREKFFERFGHILGIRIKGDERLLGSSDFVERVLKPADEQLEEKYRLRVSAISLPGLMDKTVSKAANFGSQLSGAGKIQKLILDN